MDKLRGKVHLFGDNINTDLIIPGQYMNVSDPEELARHCMEGADDNFTSRLVPGDIIVGGSNFGCGSSREHAPISIKYAGVSCIIAKSYARIFFRNAINIALPAIVSEEAAGAVSEGDELEVDLENGVVENLTRKESYPINPYPPFMLEILRHGGVVNLVREED